MKSLNNYFCSFTRKKIIIKTNRLFRSVTAHNTYAKTYLIPKNFKLFPLRFHLQSYISENCVNFRLFVLKKT